jgi:hypothetical protein
MLNAKKSDDYNSQICIRIKSPFKSQNIKSLYKLIKSMYSDYYLKVNASPLFQLKLSLDDGWPGYWSALKINALSC